MERIKILIGFNLFGCTENVESLGSTARCVDVTEGTEVKFTEAKS